MPSTHVNANKENVVVVVVVVVVIWLKRRVPILSVAIMSGAWAPTVSFSPPPPPPRGPWGWGACVTPPRATAKETGAPNDFSLSVLRKK